MKRCLCHKKNRASKSLLSSPKNLEMSNKLILLILNAFFPTSYCRIRPRHLEMEPLCCISSCLVRGGCTAIICFEVAYVITTVLLIAIRIHRERRFWTPNDFSASFSAIVTHHFFLYVIGAFDVITLTMVTVLSQALIKFDKQLVRLHWYFDFVSLIFNTITFIVYLVAVSIESSENWDIINIAFTLCFAIQIPLQLWAITVVRSCYDFFNLLHVFIQLAEK
uniref:G protein-coupled receptor n=1 Tax=Syphacia muris TaxID=451379 RepID=A0A0N5AC80_9BILA